jgi:hypothetical protein
MNELHIAVSHAAGFRNTLVNQIFITDSSGKVVFRPKLDAAYTSKISGGFLISVVKEEPAMSNTLPRQKMGLCRSFTHQQH